MWTRGLLKANAKNALRGRYWACFLACLAVSLLGGLNGLRLDFFMDAGSGRGISAHYGWGWHFDLGHSVFAWLALPFLLLAATLALAIGLCFAVFVAGPLSVGISRYMMENRFGYSPFETIFSVFRGPYLNVVKAYFWLVAFICFSGHLQKLPVFYGALSPGRKPLHAPSAGTGAERRHDRGGKVEYFCA